MLHVCMRYCAYSNSTSVCALSLTTLYPCFIKYSLAFTNSMHPLNHELNASSQSRTQCILSITNSMHPLIHELNASSQSRTQCILSIPHDTASTFFQIQKCIADVTNSESILGNWQQRHIHPKTLFEIWLNA